MVYSIVLNDLPGSYENFTRRFVMLIKSAPQPCCASELSLHES
jgi:hypothetical protein